LFSFWLYHHCDGTPSRYHVGMTVLAVVNQKGGTGKTTTAVNLAAALATQGERVLIVDLDPQATASAWLGQPEGGRGLADLLTDGTGALSELTVPSTAPGVNVVASSSTLTGVERYHALSGTPGAEYVLRDALRMLPNRYDWIFIDCSPSLGLLVVSALTAADRVLVPVETSVLAYTAVGQLLRTVDAVQARLNPQLVITGMLACRVSRTRHAQDVMELLRKRFGSQVLKTQIRETVRLREAAAHRLPITEYAPGSIGAEDYTNLATELMAYQHDRVQSAS
jgi:chromosome partitioning protein